MSVLRYSLIFLPIHHYSYEKYYKRHDEYVEKEKKKEEKYLGVPFEQLSEANRRGWENLWWWPPWKYNDIVGYMEIGMDIGDCFTADIYLKRKYLPKQHPNRRIGRSTKTHEFLYFCEIHKVAVRGEDNSAYFEALKKIIKEAKRVLRKRNKSFKLFIPSFDLDCIDFSRAHRQLIQRNR